VDLSLDRCLIKTSVLFARYIPHTVGRDVSAENQTYRYVCRVPVYPYCGMLCNVIFAPQFSLFPVLYTHVYSVQPLAKDFPETFPFSS
jgi:hypothetical protein